MVNRPRAAARFAIGLGVVGTLGLGVPPASALADEDPIADCLARQQIWVAVYYEGEPLAASCTEAATGFERLAEFTTVETAGQGFVCKLDGQPEVCEIPTGDGPYWNYWWWRDGQWRYATMGGSYAGEPGSIEAWNFSAGVEPPVAGDQATAGAATSQPSASQPGAEPSASPDPQPTGGLPGWAPTALTIAAVGIVGGGYALFRRRQD